MYKALNESIRDSDKLAELSDFAYRCWNQGLATSDMTGRISSRPKKFWAHAMPLVEYAESKFEGALKELQDKRLVHFYAVEGKQYMVYHEHDEHNRGTKNLRNIHPDCPPPPPDLCYCITYAKGEETPTADGTAVPTADGTAGVPFLSVPVPVLVLVPEGVQGEPTPEPLIPTSPEGQLIKAAEQQRIIAKPETLRRYVTGWISDRGFEGAQKAVMDPWSRGKDILSVHDRFFRVNANGNGKNGHGPPAWKPKRADPDCKGCDGKGRKKNPITDKEMDCSCVR